MFCVCRETFLRANHQLCLVLPAESPGRVGTLHRVPGTSQPVTLGTPARPFPKHAQACASPAPVAVSQELALHPSPTAEKRVMRFI